MHELSCFVTLTYDDEHLPPTGTLVKRHFQNFIRYLRRQHVGTLRYYACGEYGDQLARPHYHALLFGIDFADKREHSMNDRGDKIYWSETLNKIWGKGHAWLGAVNLQSAGYVARYCLKKVNGDLAESHYQGLQPEFSLMSLKPGIGQQWYEKYKSDVFPSDFLIIQGKRRGVPRYYDEKHKQDDEDAYKLMKLRRVAYARKCKFDNTPGRLAVRKECTEARVKLLKRAI